MKLTPVRKQDASAGTAEASSIIAIDPSTIQTMGIRTAEVARGPLRHVIRTVASVDYDETALADVTTKFKGWIEKLYVDATGARVNPGDPLFEIYSPELHPPSPLIPQPFRRWAFAPPRSRAGRCAG